MGQTLAEISWIISRNPPENQKSKLKSRNLIHDFSSAGPLGVWEKAGWLRKRLQDLKL